MKNKKVIIIAVVAVVVVLAGWWIYSMYGGAYMPAGQTSKPASPTIGVATSATLGQYLVSPNGMTLYAKKGESGSSTCYDQCAVNWPPFAASKGVVLSASATGILGTIKRTDGTYQFTYNNKPLYNWTGDKAVGDTTGDGVGGVWSVVKP